MNNNFVDMYGKEFKPIDGEIEYGDLVFNTVLKKARSNSI